MNYDSVLELTFKFFLTALLCSLIGLERAVRHRGVGAGLRTHILVGLGSCLIVLTSFHVFEIHQDITIVDPSRMIAGVITGIGFLCAGTIIRGGAGVVGLTTAATVWIATGIGMAVGAGQYLEPTVLTVMVLFVLTILRSVEDFFLRKTNRESQKGD